MSTISYIYSLGGVLFANAHFKIFLQI